MSLMYNDTYEFLDINLSDSNTGAKKGKSVIKHIFILNDILTNNDILTISSVFTPSG